MNKNHDRRGRFAQGSSGGRGETLLPQYADARRRPQDQVVTAHPMIAARTSDLAFSPMRDTIHRKAARRAASRGDKYQNMMFDKHTQHAHNTVGHSGIVSAMRKV